MGPRRHLDLLVERSGKDQALPPSEVRPFIALLLGAVWKFGSAECMQFLLDEN